MRIAQSDEANASGYWKILLDSRGGSDNRQAIENIKSKIKQILILKIN